MSINMGILEYKDYNALQSFFAVNDGNISDRIGFNYDPNDINAPLEELLSFVGYQ